jgi:hypothetical protein
MITIDWLLILEFSKVLAGPAAAVAVVYLGLRNFTRQKTLERRLEWCERAVRELQNLQRVTARFLGPIPSAKKPPDNEWKELTDTMDKVSDTMAETLLYGTQDAYNMMYEWEQMIGVLLARSARKGDIDVAAFADQLTSACLIMASLLGKDIRRLLGIQQLDFGMPERMLAAGRANFVEFHRNPIPEGLTQEESQSSTMSSDGPPPTVEKRDKQDD